MILSFIFDPLVKEKHFLRSRVISCSKSMGSVLPMLVAVAMVVAVVVLVVAVVVVKEVFVSVIEDMGEDVAPRNAALILILFARRSLCLLAPATRPSFDLSLLILFFLRFSFRFNFC